MCSLLIPLASLPAAMIGKLLAFLASRSTDGAIAWGIRTWEEFVEDGQVYSLAIAGVPGRQAREAAWRSGLARAARFMITAGRPAIGARQAGQMPRRTGD